MKFQCSIGIVLKQLIAHSETSVTRKNHLGASLLSLEEIFDKFYQLYPEETREQIVSASLRRSNLWNDICVLTLDLNMRLDSTDLGNANFAKFLMEVVLIYTFLRLNGKFFKLRIFISTAIF